MYAVQNVGSTNKCKPEKEAIHSGQFMVSNFVAEDQDDEDDVAVPIPEVNETKDIIEVRTAGSNRLSNKSESQKAHNHPPPLAIDTSLSKLFQCMSLAYRQKLTSPKWNRFRGIRLRWKDKIRLNNVIWRCWHLQFIKKENTLICQFASPLEVDTHNKPEAVVLEGKYWKRKLEAVTAEYKKWRMFYRNQALGHSKDITDFSCDIELFTGNSQSSESMHMMVDADYMDLMSDTLFSTITSQPFAFPDSREIARAGLADFIQPSLGPLQPNLDDYMDTFEPLHEFMTGKLPTVPEEHNNENMYKSIGYYNYVDLDLIGNNAGSMEMSEMMGSYNRVDPKIEIQDLNSAMPSYGYETPKSLYQPTVISKPAKEDKAQIKLDSVEPSIYAPKPPDDLYQNYMLSDFKVPQQNANASQTQQGYKFPSPAAPNLKFSSKREDKPATRSQRGRRSRSNPREPTKRPPLVSAVSDPSLLNSSNSVLLTQLLTNNTDSSSLFSRTTQDRAQICVKEENTQQLPILASQPTNTQTTALIIAPVALNPVQNAVTDPLMLNTLNDANLQQSINSPTSSQGSLGSPNRDTSRDQRRVGHIHAEQKRRYNIKNGFDMLHSLIPQLNQNPNAKLSKAAMLQKGAEYIRQLRTERLQLTEEMESLKQEIERLNTSISNCQSLLPATGAPVSRRRDSKIQDMFDKYVRTRTLENWKFWIFSLLFRPLLMSFNNFVSTQSLEELYRSTLHWIEQHCTLVDLRPIVLNSLRYLCTQTDILSDPDKLPEEVRQAVAANKHNQNKPL